MKNTKPATHFFLTIEYGHVVVQFEGTHGGKHTRRLFSIEDASQFFTSKAHEARTVTNEIVINRSSSLDYPHEYEATPEALELIAALNRDELRISRKS